MAEPNPASRDCAIRTIKRTVRVPGSRRVENTRRERTLSIPYNERTGSVPREYLTHRDRTSTVPRPYLDGTSTVLLDRTGRVPVVRFINFSTGDTVCVLRVVSNE